MPPDGYEIGIVGLGIMGHNLALNLAGQGYAVAGYDRDPLRVEELRADTEDLQIRGYSSIDAMVGALLKPSVVLLLLPAGEAVDDVITDLLERLHPKDILIDGGNSHFRDTDRRIAALEARGILYLGVGISGGEQGARNGPSLMAGGDREAYERIRPFFEAAAARIDGEPCATYLGPGSVGHYVKMVHNGIEYALMQLIAECYGIMKQGMGFGSDKLHAVFEQWNREELNSYLLEITAQIFSQTDAHTGLPLIDTIPDEVGLRGTGKWSIQDAMELEVPVPAIAMAVAMRALSTARGERESASAVLAGPKNLFQGERKAFLEQLKNALYASMIITFAQGMNQVSKASRTYDYHLNMADVARVWRGGCIIRSALVKEILLSYQDRPELVNLLLDPYLGQEVMARQSDLRNVVRTAAELGIAVPAFMASLAYYDSYRSDWLPLNLVQAQRDHLGFHATFTA